MIKIKTEVYDRVSGYFRPVNQFNAGKREEQQERKRMNKEDLNDRIRDTSTVSDS